jgi:hypothetical protein
LEPNEVKVSVHVTFVACTNINQLKAAGSVQPKTNITNTTRQIVDTKNEQGKMRTLNASDFNQSDKHMVGGSRDENDAMYSAFMTRWVCA